MPPPLPRRLDPPPCRLLLLLPQFGKYLVEKQRQEWADNYVGERASPALARAAAP